MTVRVNATQEALILNVGAVDAVAEDEVRVRVTALKVHRRRKVDQPEVIFAKSASRTLLASAFPPASFMTSPTRRPAA